MMLWIALTLLTAAVAVAMAVPVIRRLETPTSDRDRRLRVSRAQLAEIDADLARGALGETEASEARLEIERAVLAVAKEAPSDIRNADTRTRLIALVVVSGWIVIGATALYSVVGRPDLPAQMRGATQTAAVSVAPATTLTATGEDSGADPAIGSVEEMIASLVTRLDADPADAEGWRTLGWSYFSTERYAQAAEAYGKAVELDPSDPDVWSAYGEVLVRAARGMVTHDALAAFDAALDINPDDARAGFFKGMAIEQAGDPQGAIDTWIALANSAPDGADWLPGVLERIEELAAASNIDLGDQLASLGRSGGISGIGGTGLTMPPQAEPGPTAADVAAASEMSDEDRQAMILGMVEGLAARLEETPDDAEGWARLVRSRMMLGDRDAAGAALARARTEFADTPQKLDIVLSAARAAGLDTN